MAARGQTLPYKSSRARERSRAESGNRSPSCVLTLSADTGHNPGRGARHAHHPSDMPNMLSGSIPDSGDAASALSSGTLTAAKGVPGHNRARPTGSPAGRTTLVSTACVLSGAKQMSTEPDIRSWPASQRLEHYQELANNLRRMAEAEKVPELRAQLLALARQYQELVTGLRTKRRLVGGAQKANVE